MKCCAAHIINRIGIGTLLQQELNKLPIISPRSDGECTATIFILDLDINIPPQQELNERPLALHRCGKKWGLYHLCTVIVNTDYSPRVGAPVPKKLDNFIVPIRCSYVQQPVQFYRLVIFVWVMIKKQLDQCYLTMLRCTP
jgi:hypothetical protein